MTEAKLSPAAAKVMLTAAAIAGTLGGWSVLALGEPQNQQAEVVDPALPDLVEISADPQPNAPARSLRVVSRPPPAPITFTRSSR